MARVSESDLEAMYSDWDSATYTPSGYSHPSSKSSDIYGILQSEFVEVSGVEGLSPVFRCAASSVSGVTHGAKLTIDSTVYAVRGVQPDGAGSVALILEEQ